VLRSGNNEFKQQGVTIIGVSTDLIAEQRAFSNKYYLPFDLLSDPDKRIIGAFGVKLEPKTGRASRETFIFRNGRMIWHDPDVTPLNQAFDIKKVIAEIGDGR
jgi:peroxiredoxin Q/BCP